MSIDPVTGGGTAERTIQLAKHLSKVGITSSILTSDVGIRPEFIESLEGIDVTVLPCLLPRFYVPRIELWELTSIITSSDVIHLMNHWTLLNAIVYAICRKTGTPYVVCPAGALPIYGRSKILKKIYNAMFGTKMIQKAARHVAITATEADQFRDYGINPALVDVIPNGIDPADFKARDARRFREMYGLRDHPFVLFMGRLNIIKGPDLLLQAFAEVRTDIPYCHLVFAGPDGGMQASLERFAAQHGLQQYVHFIGYVGGEEKSWAYHAAELLAIPSRQEAMSIVAIEAGISGTPVLMTNVCGFNQIAAIGAGIIVQPTVAGIREGLVQLSDGKKMKTMGRRLKKLVLENYTWNSVVKKYIRLFEEILHPS